MNITELLYKASKKIADEDHINDNLDLEKAFADINLPAADNFGQPDFKEVGNHSKPVDADNPNPQVQDENPAQNKALMPQATDENPEQNTKILDADNPNPQVQDENPAQNKVLMPQATDENPEQNTKILDTDNPNPQVQDENPAQNKALMPQATDENPEQNTKILDECLDKGTDADSSVTADVGCAFLPEIDNLSKEDADLAKQAALMIQRLNIKARRAANELDSAYAEQIEQVIRQLEKSLS